MPRNKTQNVEVVNRRYSHPRNIINALTEKLTHQKVFEGEGGAFGLDITDTTGSFDPTGTDGEVQTAAPAEIVPVDEDADVETIQPGTVVEEELVEGDGFYTTTFAVEYFNKVWFDGVLAFPTIHWTVSDSNTLVPNERLLIGTIITAQYVVGFD